MVDAARMLTRFLGVGTFWKILLANVLIVAGALLLAPDAMHVMRPGLSQFGVLAAVTLITLVVNAVVLRIALAPLTELERAAERVANGDLTVRARVSPLADRPLAGLAYTFNRMVQSVEAQRQQGRDVASRVLTDSEETKHRLSRDLRDDTAQTLTSALIRLRGIKSIDDHDAREAAVDDVRSAIAEVIDQLRSFAGQLRPSSLDLLGVDQVIESYAADAARGTGIRVAVMRESLRGLLPPGAELELLRVVQALVDRALVQSDSTLHLDLRREGPDVVVGVTADGGKAIFQPADHAALFALRERASYFGGSIDVSNAPGEATARVRFPLNTAG